jgi:regulator of protease activity HflC (stomatin/prohibitin superfamily)
MGQVLDRARSIGLRLAAGAVLVAIAAIYGLAGITSVELGEVGLKISAVGSSRGEVSVLTPGTQWVEPISNDVVVYDARLKQYAMDDTTAATQDGQPIDVDASLEIGLVGENVPQLHKTMGPNWFANVVYPQAIKELREATASVKSDDIYTGKGRQTVQDLSTDALKKYEVQGIRISVNLRDVTFTNKTYVQLLEQKAAAVQKEVIETRQAAAAIQEAIKVANIAEGEKQKRIKAAEAQREEQKLTGEGSRLAKEEEAKGNLALARAEAEGIRLRNDALEGSGGDRIVQIEWERNLGPNVKVYGIPTGSPGTTNLMDLNGILGGAFKGAAK